MKHVPHLFVVASWVLKKHVKISGLQRITSDLRQEVFYKKRTCHKDLRTRNTKSIQKPGEAVKNPVTHENVLRIRSNKRFHSL